MNQNFIFEWLQQQRLSGSEDYFTVKEIKMGVCSNKAYNGYARNIGHECIRLYAFGYLELINPHSWRRGYRLKKKFLKVLIITSPLNKDLTAQEYRDRG
jgi:hypothetical protein